MNTNVLDELRLVRPIPLGVSRLHELARRACVVGAVYAAFAVAGSAAVPIACVIPASFRPVVLGIAVITAVSFGAQKLCSGGPRRPVLPPVGELTPVLLLYAHDKIAKTAVTLKRPHDYVYEAFSRLLDSNLEIVNVRRSMVTALCSTIDELIARDAAKRLKA